MNLYIPIQKSFTKAPAKEVVIDHDSIAESIDPAKRLAYWKAECIGLKEKNGVCGAENNPPKNVFKKIPCACRQTAGC